MLKRFAIVILVLVILAIAIMFTALNKGTVDLNFGFFEGKYAISTSLVITFALGCLFGMLCMTAFVFRLINERRVLRRSLRVSESEVTSLRNLPLSDAD